MDSDSERFRGQAQFLGGLFQSERGGSKLQRSVSITPLQLVRSQEIASQVRSYLTEQFMDDPEVLKAALKSLLDDLDAN